MSFKWGLFLLFIPVCASQSDSTKWVWGDGRSRIDNTRIVSNEKRYNGELVAFSKPIFQANSNYNDRRFGNSNYRYEVTENPYPGNVYRPKPTDQYRPDNNKPVNPYRPPDYYRPITRPPENEYRPVGNGYRPSGGDYSLHGLRPGVGTNGKPILTGPTPSWEEQGGQNKYKDYDICKCVHSFNCNTPGIKFGSCDADKQYCCYKSRQGENVASKPGSGVYPVERPKVRPVLAGPGGPTDFPKRYQDKFSVARPYRPDVEKSLDSDREFEEAYKKGLASAIYELYQRPSGYYDKDPQGYRDYYQPDTEHYKPSDNYKSSHPTKYGLYYPSDGVYGRASNSSISAISDTKN